MDVKTLRDNADIQKVCSSIGMPVKKMGISYFCQCPIHDDDHPSAFFKEGDNYVYCPVCSKNINAIDLIMAYNNTDFKDALETLKSIEGIMEDTDFKSKKPDITPTELATINLKPNNDDILSKKEFKGLIRARIIRVQKKIKDIESFLDIKLVDENNIVNSINKKLGAN